MAIYSKSDIIEMLSDLHMEYVDADRERRDTQKEPGEFEYAPAQKLVLLRIQIAEAKEEYKYTRASLEIKIRANPPLEKMTEKAYEAWLDQDEALHSFKMSILALEGAEKELALEIEAANQRVKSIQDKLAVLHELVEVLK